MPMGLIRCFPPVLCCFASSLTSPIDSAVPPPRFLALAAPSRSLQLFEVAKLKSTDSEDLSLVPVQKIFKTIVHQCKGMGIKVDYRTDADFAAGTGPGGASQAAAPAAAAGAPAAKPAAAAAKPAAAVAAKPAAPAAAAAKKK